MTLEDIAKRLGCTYSNASWLLRHGVLHGVKKGGEWIVTEEDFSEYFHRKKRRRPPQIILHAGDTFGFWTVIEPDRYNKHGQRAALCRCVCGKESVVTVSMLVHKRSESCGCKKHLKMSAAQKEALQRGRKIMNAIHEEKLVAGLQHSLNKNSTTGHKGVSFMPKYGTYRAYITIHRKQIHLGCFSSLDDAIQSRKAAEAKYLTSYREKVEEIKKEKL